MTTRDNDRHPGGGPTELTPEVQGKIAEVIKAGNYVETASAFAGVGKTTLHDWLERGDRERERVAANQRRRVRKDEAIYVEFSKAVEQAWAESEVEDVKDLRGQDWKAALARLERKFPDRWGQKERHEHTVKNGVPTGYPLTVMDLVKLAYSDEDGNGHDS